MSPSFSPPDGKAGGPHREEGNQPTFPEKPISGRTGREIALDGGMEPNQGSVIPGESGYDYGNKTGGQQQDFSYSAPNMIPPPNAMN
jgi:hypothetical protein